MKAGPPRKTSRQSQRKRAKPSRRALTRALPNSITITALALGFSALIASAEGEARLAAWLIIVAMILDMADGATARALSAVSKFGQRIDSLTDIISFGAAPAFLVYTLSAGGAGSAVFAAIFPICCAIRLARFEPGTRSFQGLPSPGAAGALISAGLIFTQWNFPTEAYSLWCAGLGILMISPYPFPRTAHLLDFDFRKTWGPWLLTLFSLSLAIFDSSLTLSIFAFFHLYLLWSAALICRP